MKKVLLLALLASGPYSLSAGPDSASNYFINNSPSLLDFGIFRLERAIQEAWDAARVIYDWDEDKIVVIYNQFKPTEGTWVPSLSSEDCREFISLIRAQAGFLDGKPWGAARHSFFSEYFTHEGYVSGNKDDHDKRLVELDKKFKLVCYTTLIPKAEISRE